MFDKKLISFSTKSIFGYTFKNSIDECFCKTSKMLFAGKINPDGTIDPAQSDAFKKSELWSYIYYIYYYNNNDIDEFKAMKSKKDGKADAVAFYNVVATIGKHALTSISSKSPETLDTKTLIAFINAVIVNNEEDLVNPIFDYLKVITEKKVLMNLEGIKLVTGKNASTFEIVHGQAAKNANIKVSLYK